jgi:putative addiction module killer protein
MNVSTFPFDIEYYIDKNGKIPFKEWLNGLNDRVARAKIRIRLDRVRLGNIGDSRPVGKGVHELRVDYGPGYRIYFAREGIKIILLLIGGDKSTQEKDIEQAKRFLNDYKLR